MPRISAQTVREHRAAMEAALLDAAEDLARKLGLDALELATATDNTAAQSLYEAQGWTRDTGFYVYGKSLR